MTVGRPDYNLDSFGIKYVKKAKEAHEGGGDSGITARTTSHLSDQDVSTSGFGDRQNDSKGDTDVKIHNQTDQPKTSKQVHSAGTDGSHGAYVGNKYGKREGRYGVGGTEGVTQGGKNTQAMTSSGKLGTPSGKKVGTEVSHDSGIKDPYSGDKRNAAGNPNTYKKPEGIALPKNAAMQLAIIKCKLLKLKSSSGDINTSAAEYNKKETVEESAKKYLKETEKGTGDKIPHEKLGDLPQGADNKEVESATIVNEKGEEKKLPSPADRYKADVRSMAIDAIDMAMKTIAVYQDAKEKAIQEELIKEAYEAQLKNDSVNTSDGVNAVYSDVHQKKINKE